MCQFSAKLDDFDLLGPNLPKSGFRVGNSEKNVGIQKFQKKMFEYESASSRCHACQFSGKRDSFDFFDPYLTKIDFGVGISKI